MSGMKVNVDEKQKTVTIVLPLNAEGELSGSQKSMVVASTKGNQASGTKLASGKELIVGCNVYFKK